MTIFYLVATVKSKVILAYSDLVGTITPAMLTSTAMGSAWGGSTCGGYNGCITACNAKAFTLT